MRGPSLPREEHKSGINNVRRKSDFKSHCTRRWGLPQKNTAVRRIRRSGETRAITKTRSWFPSGRRRRTPSACPARYCRGATARNERGSRVRLDPEGRATRGREGKPEESRLAVSLDISALLARWSFSRAGWLNLVRSCRTGSREEAPCSTIRPPWDRDALARSPCLWYIWIYAYTRTHRWSMDTM